MLTQSNIERTKQFMEKRKQTQNVVGKFVRLNNGNSSYIVIEADFPYFRVFDILSKKLYVIEADEIVSVLQEVEGPTKNQKAKAPNGDTTQEFWNERQVEKWHELLGAIDEDGHDTGD